MKKRTKEENRAYTAMLRERKKDVAPNENVAPNVAPNENVSPMPVEELVDELLHVDKTRSRPTGAFELEPLDSSPPSGVDKVKWRVAQGRAEVARRYAQPERYQFIRPDEEAFQTVRWQYDELVRYPVPSAPER